MKKIGFRTQCLLSLIFIAVMLVGQAEAKAPWKWQMSLKTAAEVGSMSLPRTLYVDGEKERYYVIDSGNDRLLSFDREGLLLHAFTANRELKTPSDMIRDESGELWVVEKGRNSLTEINIPLKQVTPHTLNDNGRLVFPDRIEYNKNGFYILDKASGDILLFDREMTVRQRIACPNETGSGGFVDFKLTDNGIWALDQRKKAVYLFGPDGNIANRVVFGKEVHSPVSFALGEGGMFYVLDRLDATIVAFDSRGQLKYSFLGAGQAQGRLYFPSEIQFDPWGQLCVVDEGNGRVEIFSR